MSKASEREPSTDSAMTPARNLRSYFDPLTSFGLASPSLGSQIRKFRRKLSHLQKARTKEAREGGIRDGQVGIPRLDEPLSATENKIRDRYQSDILLIQQRFDEPAQSRRAHHMQARNDLVSLTKEYEKIKKEWETQCKIEGRKELNTQIPRKVYLGIPLLVFLGEFPLNTLVFTAFRESLFMTMIMAATIAFSIPLIAHFVGIWLKQHDSIEHAYKKALIASAMAVVGLASIASLRYSYFLYIIGENALLHSANFFFVNLLVFSFLVAASMLSHDESPQLELTYWALAKIRTLVEKKTNTVAALMAVNDSILEDIHGLENYIEALYFEAINAYRLSNRQERNDDASPRCWGPKGSANIPPLEFHFRNLEELDVTRQPADVTRQPTAKSFEEDGKIIPFPK